MKQAIFILLISLAFVACKKDGHFENAVVQDWGAPAVDGCGWMVIISSTAYKPTNLPAQYEKDNLNVQIKYEKLNSRADCGFALDAYPEIRIEEIK